MRLRPTRLLLLTLLVAGAALAQDHPASPRGSCEAQLGGKSGKWITVDYGRPLLRGRTNIFGTGAEYGKQVYAGAPIWRAGANATTRMKTELPLRLGARRLAPGEYDLFVDLKDGAWTLVVSTQPALEKYDAKRKDKIWGSYGYDPKFDVVRLPMTMGKSEPSVEQLTIAFLDVGDKGGKLQMAWEHTTATVPFATE